MQIAKPELNSLFTKVAQPGRLRSALLLLLGAACALSIAIFVARGAWTTVVLLAAVLPAIVLLGKRPFLGIILWLLLMPFVSVLPSSNLAYWAIYRILPPALLLSAGISRLLKIREFTPARFGPPEMAMIILGLMVPGLILASQISPSLSLIRFADRVLLPFCMYLVVRLIAPREKEFRQLQWLVLFIALSQSLIGFLSWFAPEMLPQVWHYLQGVRTTGSLKDPDLYAAMLIFSGALLIHAAINHKSGLIRLGFFMASGLCAIFVFLSLERAAWLGAIFVIIGLIFLYPKTMIRLLIIGSIITLILMTGLLASHFALSVNRFSDSSPVYDRLVVFDAMSQMILLKPALGWGYETLDQNVQQFYRRVGEATLVKRMVTSHNTYLTVLTELGIVGFVLYMFPVLWWFVLTLRVWGRMPSQGLWSRSLLGVLWLVMLFQFTVSNFFDMRWFPIGLTLWWLTLGLIANIVYPYLKGRGGQLPESSRVN